MLTEDQQLAISHRLLSQDPVPLGGAQGDPKGPQEPGGALQTPLIKKCLMRIDSYVLSDPETDEKLPYHDLPAAPPGLSVFFALAPLEGALAPPLGSWYPPDC